METPGHGHAEGNAANTLVNVSRHELVSLLLLFGTMSRKIELEIEIARLENNSAATIKQLVEERKHVNDCAKTVSLLLCS